MYALNFKVTRNAINLETASKMYAHVQIIYHVECLKRHHFSFQL